MLRGGVIQFWGSLTPHQSDTPMLPRCEKGPQQLARVEERRVGGGVGWCGWGWGGGWGAGGMWEGVVLVGTGRGGVAGWGCHRRQFSPGGRCKESERVGGSGRGPSRPAILAQVRARAIFGFYLAEFSFRSWVAARISLDEFPWEVDTGVAGQQFDTRSAARTRLARWAHRGSDFGSRGGAPPEFPRSTASAGPEPLGRPPTEAPHGVAGWALEARMRSTMSGIATPPRQRVASLPRCLGGQEVVGGPAATGMLAAGDRRGMGGFMWPRAGGRLRVHTLPLKCQGSFGGKARAARQTWHISTGGSTPARRISRN